jgi:hypothetical protein
LLHVKFGQQVYINEKNANLIANAPTWLAYLITTTEQKDQFNVELCKIILEHETTIKSQKEEIEKLKKDLNAKLVFVSDGQEQDRWVLQEQQIALIESLQKDSGYLRKLLSDLRPLIGSKLSDDAVSVAQKEIDFSLSHIQAGKWYCYECEKHIPNEHLAFHRYGGCNPVLIQEGESALEEIEKLKLDLNLEKRS